MDAIRTALTGLDASARRLSASASNIANLQTVGSLEEDGQKPYTPIDITQESDARGGVNTSFVPRDNPFVPTYDPDSRFADENGIIGVPNIDLAQEAVNSQLAAHSYKANLGVIKTAQEMESELLKIFDDEG